MTQYHINQETDRVNICRAKPGNCPLKNTDGTIAEHFSSKEEALKYKEEELAKKFSNTRNILTKTSAQRSKKKTALKTLTEEENIELTRRMIAEHEKLKEKLDKNDQNMLFNYTFTSSSLMNRILHNNLRDEEKERNLDYVKDQIKQLDRILAEHGQGKERRTVYRYIRLDKKTNVQKYIEKTFKNGEAYSDTGFMSTTEDLAMIAGYAKKWNKTSNFVVLEIETDKGISLQREEEHVGNLLSFEKERLLPRDLTFEVAEHTTETVKIDPSRQNLLKQFGNSSWVPKEDKVDTLPAKRFEVIKLIDQSM